MTKFEQRGVELQQEANSMAQANRNFSYSCEICCNRGLRISCDCCAIRCAHQLTAAYFASEAPFNRVSKVCVKRGGV